MVVDDQGTPICCEIWPGNTTDVKSLIPVVERLSTRFGIERVCIVADRGMFSQENKEDVKARRGWSYILGARLRSVKEVRDTVLSRAGRYKVVQPPRVKAKDPAPLKVKNVQVGKTRYVVCLNEEQQRKDQADREAILTSLQDKLRHSGKELVGNRGYRKFLKRGKFEIDEEAVRRDSRYDGKWVLETNLTEDAGEVALMYKQLWMIEDIFRSSKSLLQTRPIYPKCHETIRGHVFCSFLALVLRKELQSRLEARGQKLEWDDVVRDLNALTETDVEKDGCHYRLRSASKGTCVEVFRAAGVALPQTVRKLK